ncbi:MAG TPA: LuxR C-terminal-related transcriptional regulator [Candidatus Acidoferrum sp.]|nr:LuxR C-terminal-related transcriptional regulator [Candidatus Acidoferrum sp.]
MRVFSSGTVPEDIKERKGAVDRSNFFVFCEKNTGVAQFRAGSLGESEGSLERVAGLFAMQCLVRGYNPEDFVVLVPAQQAVVGELVSRARELLEEGRSVAGPADLSPRQREVLHSVLCNRANKEIACKLNITVRTVKFHISTLLSKFGVENRAELARRAAGLLQPMATEGQTSIGNPVTVTPNVERADTARPLGPRPVNTNFRVEQRRSVRFNGQAATA